MISILPNTQKIMEKRVGSYKIKHLNNAVQSEQLDLVEKILAHGIPESEPHVSDYSILLTALKKKQCKIAKLLINAGCRVEATLFEKGITPLALAFIIEDLKIASMIMKNGATIRVNYSTSRSTVLHLAVQRKSLKMLEFILGYNVDVNFCDSYGKTALQILFETCMNQESNDEADREIECEMIRLLLSKGASVDFEYQDNCRGTFLHYVVKLKQKHTTLCVLQKMNVINSCDYLGRTALHYYLYNDYKSEGDVTEIVNLFIEKGAKLDIADRYKITVAHIAAEKKYLKILNIFLQCQCNVDFQDCYGNTVLYKLLENSLHLNVNQDYNNLVTSILSITTLQNIQNSSGKTSLHLAAENYHYQILEKMLPKIENVNVSDNNGQSLLHILLNSFSNKNVDIIKYLLNAGANVDMENLFGMTPVDLALKTGDKSLALLVLQHSKNLNQYHQPKSVLHHLSDLQISSESEQLQVAKIAKSCINQGLNIDVLDALDKTPLYAAVFNRCKYLVKILLECGANPNFSTSVDIIQYIAARSPLKNVDLEIADMLISKGASIILTFNDLLALIKHIDKYKSIMKLLNHCGNLNVLDLAGNTVLHAIFNSALYRNKIMYSIFNTFFSFFLSKGISVNAQNKNGETLLHLAAKNKHYKIVEKLLPKFENVNVTDCYGETLLHITARHFCDENYAIMFDLLSRGADVDIKNAYELTPISIALKIGNKDLLLPLLQCSKNLKQYYFDNKTLLHYLSYFIHDEKLEMTEIAKTCLEHGIHVDVIDDTLSTPLLAAVLNQNKFMIEFLLDHGADPNYDPSITGAIIEYVIRKPSFSAEDLEIAELLVSKGAGKVITFEGLVSLLKLTDTQSKRLLIINILERCETLNVLDSFGNTILHAFLDSNVQDKDANGRCIAVIVEFLIAKGILVNAHNDGGTTALHLAVKNKHVLISQLLIRNDANIVALDNYGNSVLHFCSMMKIEIDANVEKKMIDLFIEEGCNVNAKNILNMTPLLTAIKSGCINVVKALIANGADIESKSGADMSYPLHIAVEYNHITIIEYLLECGANIYSKRGDGKTALHLAAVYEKSGTLTLLLERLMDPDVRDDNGRTALHWACWHGNLQIVKELLIRGADVNAVNEYHEYNVTPITYNEYNATPIIYNEGNVTPIIYNEGNITSIINYNEFDVTPLITSVQSLNVAVSDELRQYRIKLRQAGLNIAEHSIDHMYYYNYYERPNDSLLQSSLAKTEVLKMQRTTINSNTTLADVLKMNINKLAIFKNNRAFNELITSDHFDEDFHCYSLIIKSFCARGIIRSNLFNDGTKALRILCNSMLSEDCTHEIFKYLSNDDLINFIQAKPPNSKLNIVEEQHWNERKFYHQQEMFAIMSI